MRKTLTNVACYYCGVEWVVIQYLLTQARFPAKRNATDSVRKVRKKRNKRKKITQSKTLRKTPFPSKRNARNCQPIEMVDLNSQSSKQPIKCLRCLRFSFTQRTQRNRLRCVRCVWMETGLETRNGRYVGLKPISIYTRDAFRQPPSTIWRSLWAQQTTIMKFWRGQQEREVHEKESDKNCCRQLQRRTVGCGLNRLARLKTSEAWAMKID